MTWLVNSLPQLTPEVYNVFDTLQLHRQQNLLENGQDKKSAVARHLSAF